MCGVARASFLLLLVLLLMLALVSCAAPMAKVRPAPPPHQTLLITCMESLDNCYAEAMETCHGRYRPLGSTTEIISPQSDWPQGFASQRQWFSITRLPSNGMRRGDRVWWTPFFGSR